MPKNVSHESFRPRRADAGRGGSDGGRDASRWIGVAAALMLCCACAALMGGDTVGGSFVRTIEKPGGAASLEIASRRYRKEGTPTEIALVGVVHVGRADYYDALQRHLDEHAIVLYESVTPRGAVRAPEDAEDPVRATRDSMLFLRRVMLALRDADRSKQATAPTPSVAAVVERGHSVDSRFGPWVRSASNDAWGRPIELELGDDDSFLLISRGADGAPGGEGADADIRLRTPAGRTSTVSADEALQPQLAELLGLEFQLDAIDYHHRTWEVADMSERELLAAFSERGVDGTPLMRTLSGSSMTASLAGASIALIRMADTLTGGRVRAFVTLALIEVIGAADERLLAQGLPPGMAEVILDRRNDVAHAAIRAHVDAAPATNGTTPAPDADPTAARPASIALFYGAAHMPDLERRLRADGWTPVSEQWFEAFSVDPTAAGLDPETVRTLRGMLRELMQDMKRGMGES